MRRTVIISLVTAGVVASIAMPSIAEENLYALKQVKMEKLFPVKSRSHIDVTPMEHYDKYLITVTGDGGFSHQFESEVPTISLYDMPELPYDGSYSYEINAVRHVVEIKDTMNNGRSEDARGFISIKNTVNGQFVAQSGEFQVFEDKKEPRKITLPIKPVKPVKPVNPFK
ncbi:hypothetical protein KO527_20455 [Pseudoalteromonas sp. C2R02]|uniref:hypothetical protein n=1 Tax=Pseudoalteromonas sp. C2R02 TaxID=2841565 RepID=UPI001C08EA83|nr:hypothetical protein [Pseudoalteromonas sp. C2R02]MBU2971726.1 hypothetical protein [Pseudoalteromonas sp. C2R02]